MMNAVKLLPAVLVALAMLAVPPAGATTAGIETSLPVPIENLVHIEGVRENALVGYGIVVGLAGTGDTARTGATVQSIANTLTRFGVRITADQVSSRNVAAVVITATMPAFPTAGDKIDVNVASAGDARSLVGGTLMLAPLHGADDQIYALAQGPLSVGGFRYDAFGNVVQKNHPTVGEIPGGATLERSVTSSVVTAAGNLYLVLNDPDYITAAHIADALNQRLPDLDGAKVVRAQAVDASKVLVRLTDDERANLVHVIASIESASVVPNEVARVVINERTGTVVSGGDVRIGQVTVAHGELKVTVATNYLVSQPLIIGRSGGGVRTEVVPDADVKVKEDNKPVLHLPEGTSVSDLVYALNKIKVSPRDMISILEAIKRAGSLRAELIIQ
jgi:flagellar P-ring protein precursor FlgI